MNKFIYILSFISLFTIARVNAEEHTEAQNLNQSSTTENGNCQCYIRHGGDKSIAYDPQLDAANKLGNAEAEPTGGGSKTNQ